MSDIRNVLIIGGGPAGYTAGLYSGRANLQPLCFEGSTSGSDHQPGGQLMTTTEVENYPGFEHGIMGPKLMEEMRAQAARFDCEIVEKDLTRVDFTSSPHTVWDEDGTAHRAWTVIIATGASSRKLGIPGEDTLFARGVSTCAVCDGAFFKNKVTAVIGGGDTAMEDANYLTHHASKVFIVHRRNELRASKIMQQRALENPKIELIWNTVPVEVFGNFKLEGAKLKNVQTEAITELPLDGFFLAIGHLPNTDFLQGHLQLEPSGYLRVDHHQRCFTPDGAAAIPGVYAAGDCHDHTWRQAVTAAGYGCAAAIAAERWLGEHKPTA